MLDGHLLIDTHVHVPILGTLQPSWLRWAEEFGPDGIVQQVWDSDGRPVPRRLDALFADQGVDLALLFCEYSPKVTGMQLFDDLLPIVECNPRRFRPVANVNPHLHFPIARELTRQLDYGAAALKLHPVHGGFSCDDSMLYPAYQVLAERGVPLVVHCGTSSFPGSMNEFADPARLLPIIRDFPELDVVLAHGGRGWWYDAAAFMAQSFEHVWIELSGLPPKRLPDYYSRHDLARLARKWIFGTDWPGVPGTATNARAVVSLGLDEATADLVLGGNALQVYAVSDPREHSSEGSGIEPGHREEPRRGEAPHWSSSDQPRPRRATMTATPIRPTPASSPGRPARELTDQELEQQGKRAHETRNWVFLHGTAEQFANHTARMLELEHEYLRRYPKRTWQGSGGALTEESEVSVLRTALRGILVQIEALIEPSIRGADTVDAGRDPANALLRRVAAAPGGRLNKLEVHQLAREVGLDRPALARLYNAEPPLLQADRQDRVITDAGRARLDQS